MFGILRSIAGCIGLGRLADAIFDGNDPVDLSDEDLREILASKPKATQKDDLAEMVRLRREWDNLSFKNKFLKMADYCEKKGNIRTADYLRSVASILITH